LPPLNEDDTKQLLQARGYDVDDHQAYALCLMSAGNQRELIRIADATLGDHVGRSSEAEIIVLTMREESSALLAEIIRTSPAPGSEVLSPRIKSLAWLALQPANFVSERSFVSFGKEAISKYWDWPENESGWDNVVEPWRRLLVRLFVSARWLELSHEKPESRRDSIFAVLFDIMIMAGQDAGVADAMLRTRFGGKLDLTYQDPPNAIEL
jgi:hypothetical protein